MHIFVLENVRKKLYVFFLQCEEIMEEHEETIISLLQAETADLEKVFCRKKSDLCPKSKRKTEL